MGFAKSIKKAGGGILHNREATITGYEFTQDTPWEQSKKNANLFYLVLSVREDGADADTQQHLFFGSTDYNTISDDGQTVKSVDRDTTTISAETGAGKFLQSLVDANFPEDRLPDLDNGAPLNLAGIIGTRVRFEQRVNEKLTKEKGKRQASNGKEYSYTDLVVGAVLSLPAAAGKSNGKAAKPTGKPGKAAPVADDVDIAELAETTLGQVLADNDGSISLKKLKMAIFGKIGVKHPQRNEVVEFATDPDNLSSMDSVEFDAKAGTVSIAA